MNCNCIRRLPSRPRPSRLLVPVPTRLRRSRATAEVELILVLPVLLTVLLLCGIAVKLGQARLANVRDAEQTAYHQVLRGQGVSASGNLTPVDNVGAVRPGLPTRFDEASPTSSPKLTEGWLDLKGVTLVNKAAFLDPTWHFAAWPMGTDGNEQADASDAKQWFTGYIDEGHPWELRYGLGLAEPWKP